MKHSTIIIAVLTASMLTACTEPNGAPGRGIENGGALSKTDVGTAVGAIGGGVIGSTIGGGAGAVVATIGGALLGGLLGNSVGQSLDNADVSNHDRAAHQAMDSGRTQSWRNPDNGNRGSVSAPRYYTNAEGQYCRAYTQKIYIDGVKHIGHGDACREADGSWHIID